jgi:hypothetical protein
LLCSNCGIPLSGGDEAALFVCAGCGLVHELGEKSLAPFASSTVAATTELAVSGPVQYLAVWRLLPTSLADDDPVWERIRRAAAPGPAYLYVPAFSLARPVVQRIGVRLTDVQPVLALTAGAPAERGSRPALAEARSEITSLPATAGSSHGDPGAGPVPDGPDGEQDFDVVSPILVGRIEAWGLAHFIYMALEARETHDLRPVELDMQSGGEDLLFFPAAWDPRYIHESNWRLLLREFDGLVA